MPNTPVAVNLLGHDDFASSSWGRLINWAVTYGRYIMVGTEIIVLLVFISRFSLDRRNTDLKEEISQKQAIITANLSVERNVSRLQHQLAQVQSLLSAQPKQVDGIGRILSVLPPDVYFESFTIAGDQVTIAAVAGSTQGFGQFLHGLTQDVHIRDITLSTVSKKPLSGIRFTMAAKIGKPEINKK